MVADADFVLAPDRTPYVYLTQAWPSSAHCIENTVIGRVALQGRKYLVTGPSGATGSLAAVPVPDAHHFLSAQGYFLLFESMLDSVLYAKSKYLAKGGSGK